MAKFQIAWDWTFRELPEPELRSRCLAANNLGLAGCPTCLSTSNCTLDAFNEGSAPPLFFIIRIEPTCSRLWCMLRNAIFDDGDSLPPCDGPRSKPDPGFLP